MKLFLMKVITILLTILLNIANSQRQRGIVEFNPANPFNERNKYHPCPVRGGKNGICVPANICRVPAYSMGFNGPPGRRGAQNHFCRPRYRFEGPMICCLRINGDGQDRPGEDIPNIPVNPPVAEVTPIPNVDLSDKMIEDKCLEYTRVAQEVEGQQESKSTDGEMLFKPFVVGGVSSLAKEFPHMAILGFGPEDDIDWKCGGSLISDRFILTAAHCVHTPALGDVSFARVGDLDLKSTTDDAQPQQIKIVQRFTHPDYDTISNYNDIALLQLEKPVTFTKYVRPACIPTADDRSGNPIATGWGHTEFAGTTSDVLQKVDLVYYTFEQCKETFGPQIKLDRGLDEASQMCAGGGPNVSKDTCQGDSGGPLQVVSQSNPTMYKIVGVTSFGKACGLTNVPAVYTNVAYFSPWIEDIVWTRE